MNAEPPRELHSDVPRAPDFSIEARVVLVHGSSVRCAGQSPDAPTHATERSNTPRHSGESRNPGSCASCALAMEISNPVQVGDKLVTPN